MADSSDWLVDRNNEKSILQQRLASIFDQDATSREIFQFYGMFGIGKTALLHAFDEIIDQADGKFEHAYVDLAKFSHPPHRLYIILQLLHQLNGPDYENGRVVAAIQEYQEYEKQFSSVFQDIKDPKSFIDPRLQYLDKVEREFVDFLRAILKHQPVVLLFDRTERFTQVSESPFDGRSVSQWLENLYVNAQIDKRLTIVLGGRSIKTAWNTRNGKVRAADPVELPLFNRDETIKHWSRISEGTPYATKAIAHFIHENTLGHPYSNECLGTKLKEYFANEASAVISNRTDQGLAPDWPLVFREATESILEEWIDGFPEVENLKKFVRAIAPLRDFDRDIAKQIFEALYPDIAKKLDEPRLQTYLTFLSAATLLDKVKTTYRMQAPIRSLILRDLAMNKKAEHENVLKLACQIYKSRVKAEATHRSPSLLFPLVTAELLYHEAELRKLSGVDSSDDLVDILQEHIDFAMGEFYDPNTIDSYKAMCEELSEFLEQDDELRRTIGESEFGSVIEKLKNLKDTLPKHSRIDVFISYNSTDKAAVEDWNKQLLDAGIVSWLDDWDITKFGSWIPELEKAIKVANSAAIFIGPSGEGPWQKKEIQALLQQAQQRPLRMGYVLLPGCPDKFEEPSVFLGNFQRVDLRRDNKNGLNELISAITGKRSNLQNRR